MQAKKTVIPKIVKLVLNTKAVNIISRFVNFEPQNLQTERLNSERNKNSEVLYHVSQIKMMKLNVLTR